MQIKARTRYKRPAQATPTQAYTREMASVYPRATPAAFTAAYPPKKAKDEPKNTGIFLPVTRCIKRVAIPANSRVELTLRPVMIGTNTVAPNIANMC